MLRARRFARTRGGPKAGRKGVGAAEEGGSAHIRHALITLELKAVTHWMEWFEDVKVIGFRKRRDHGAFYAWMLASGIDWRVPPDEQPDRSAPQPPANWRQSHCPRK